LATRPSRGGPIVNVTSVREPHPGGLPRHVGEQRGGVHVHFEAQQSHDFEIGIDPVVFGAFG
jgi:hypothetical protein